MTKEFIARAIDLRKRGDRGNPMTWACVHVALWVEFPEWRARLKGIVWNQLPKLVNFRPWHRPQMKTIPFGEILEGRTHA